MIFGRTVSSVQFAPSGPGFHSSLLLIVWFVCRPADRGKEKLSILNAANQCLEGGACNAILYLLFS